MPTVCKSCNAVVADKEEGDEVCEVEESDEDDILPSYKLFLGFLCAQKIRDDEEDNSSNHEVEEEEAEESEEEDIPLANKLFFDMLRARYKDDEDNHSRKQLSNPDYVASSDHSRVKDKKGKLKMSPSSNSESWEFSAFPSVDYYLDSIQKREPSKFKRRLMRLLNQPFDQKEYDDLMTEATVRRPGESVKDLRNGKFCKKEKVGPSYLDYYPDLAGQIESAEPPAKLLLLRSFFFWLQNCAHKGSFKPWTEANDISSRN